VKSTKNFADSTCQKEQILSIGAQKIFSRHTLTPISANGEFCDSNPKPRTKSMRHLALFFYFLLLIFPWACSSASKNISSNSNPSGVGQPIYKDPQQPVERRVRDLLARMTLDEKVAQTQCLWFAARRFMDANGQFVADSAVRYMPVGIGQIARPKEPLGGVGTFPSRSTEETVRYCNDVQRFLRENTRLGIPAIMHEESLHGYVARDATAFPQAIGLASTWNRSLVERAFDVAAREARSCGNHLVLAPVVDVTRDPRWGRTEETYGEDPYLAGEIGLAAVRGFQGRNNGRIDNQHVMATLKHITGHGQPEGGNNIAPAATPRRTVLEQFLPPFKKCIIDGHALNVMPSYNEIDGVPSHANTWLLSDILRKEWGFQGAVVSDYGAIGDLYTRHRIATSLKEAAKRAISSGVDVETPDPQCYPFLKEIFEKKELPIAVLDSAVSRVLRQKFMLGLFETPYADVEKAKQTVGAAENQTLALQAAEEAIVLLKNEGNLAPIDLNRYKKIALVGPNGNRTLLGGYSDEPRYFTTVFQGLAKKVGERGRGWVVSHVEGCGISQQPCSWYKDPIGLTDPKTDRQKIEQAIGSAKIADLIVLAIGGDECESREGWAENHLGDQATMNLRGLQDSLFEALYATGKPIVVLLLNGRPYSIPNIAAKAPVIFECWYLGQECGTAIARVLFGDVSPSGKLPITFPRSAGHLPVFYNYKPTARRGYAFDDVSPLFPFGYGLSYTTFDIGKPVLSKPVISPKENVTVTVTVRNAGRRVAQEVVQLYIRDLYSSVTRPVKELKGFEKVEVQPSDTKTVQFTLTPEDLSMYDLHMNWVVEPGEFEIMVGNSSRDQDLKKVVLTVK